MLFDWVTAIVIIFTLHYLISFILTITNSISDVFNANIVGEDGRDIIFSNLRTEIGETPDFGSVLVKTVMYYALIILTIKFTIQYLKRVVYVAFLTMIAPLIGLTYPLDKIKDGQAQALSMWIREFLFNALIQPFQLILYYVFVGSSVMENFATENPFYALVVLAFMGPAEKMLRKMFGFDKGGKLGNVEAAFGGATVMNMINKLGHGSSRGGKGAKGENQSSESVRTVNQTPTDPYAALREDGGEGSPQTNNPPSGGRNSSEGGTPSGGENPSGGRNSSDRGTPFGGGNSSDRGTPFGGERSSDRGTPLGGERSSDRGIPFGGDTPRGESNSENGNPTTDVNNLSRNSPKNSREDENNRTGNTSRTSRTGDSGVFRRKTPETENRENKPPKAGEDTIRFKKDRTDPSNRDKDSNESKDLNKNKNPNKETNSRRNRNKETILQKAKRTKRNVENIPTIKGIRNVTGGASQVFKAAGKGTIRVAGMITVGTVGLAAGIATGEMENAVAGAVGGIAAGNRIGKNITNRSRASGSLRETYENGKYGEKEAKRIREVREFKRSSKYQKLLDKFPEKEKEIDKFLNAGITDAGKIRIALQNSNNFSTDNAIAYMNMAKLCPSEIFENRDKFNVYLEAHGIPKGKAQEIYDAVRKFK